MPVAAYGTDWFDVVRRGYDPEQVTQRLQKIEVENTMLSADRDAAVERSNRFEQELETCRAEAQRLRSLLDTLRHPPETVESMNHRMQVMLRLARHEFAGLHVESGTGAGEAIAGVEQEVRHAIAEAERPAGSAEVPFVEVLPATGESEGERAEVERDIDRMRRAAEQERARLHEAAVARQAEAEEELRAALALRCREAMAQLAAFQANGLRHAREVLDDVEAQIRVKVAEAREAARIMIAEAKREVAELHATRDRLRKDLDVARSTLDSALPGRAAPDDGTGEAAQGDPATVVAVRNEVHLADAASR